MLAATAFNGWPSMLSRPHEFIGLGHVADGPRKRGTLALGKNAL